MNEPQSPSQSPTGSKKPRKMRQVIDEATWKAVEGAICIGGLGYSEAGRKFGIEPHAIMGKAKRNNWPLPSMIQKRAEALQAARYKAQEYYKPYEETRNGNEEVIQAVAETWAEKGEMHRQLAFTFAHDALKAAAKAGLPVENWRAAALADTMARKASGLDHADQNVTNVNLDLVNFRLTQISASLPKDALPGSPSPQPQSLRE